MVETGQALSLCAQKCIFAKRITIMIKKVVKIRNINDKSLLLDDLEYWLSKSHEERVAAVDYLRRQFHGSSERLQRVVRVIQRT